MRTNTGGRIEQSAIEPKATITVGEQGTVAAAVTEIGLSATGIPQEPEHRFVADRPSLMVVQGTTTGWDLFQSVVRSIG